MPDVWPLTGDEGADFWRDFRVLRPAATYSFEFTLRHMPRRGDGPVFDGILWGGMTNRGSVTRLVLYPDGSPDDVVEYLALNARQPELWRWTPATGLESIETTESLDPLIEGILFSPFDVAMPFLFWEDYVYQRSERVRGRGTHVFNLTPPDDEEGSRYPDIGLVSVAVDTQFDAMLRIQVHDTAGALARSMNMLNFRRADDRWIVRTMDLVDENSRDKTRFTITGAAFDIPLSATDFTPEALGGNRPVVEDAVFSRF